jgi:acetyl esterase/lipase
VDEFEISARDDYAIAIRSYRQSSLHDHGLPTLIYLYGGGYVTGGLETDDTSCRAVATQVPVMVLSVEYRLAPEHKFPVGFEDSFDAVKWV